MLASPTTGRSAVLAVVFMLCAAAVPAGAQTLSDLMLPSSPLDHSPLLYEPVAPDQAMPDATMDRDAPSSVTTLRMLQVSFVGLQALDVASTINAVNAGHEEGNPLMRGVADNSVAMASVKIGAAASTLILSQHVARKNRTASIILMAAMNTALAVVVTRNIRTPDGR